MPDTATVLDEIVVSASRNPITGGVEFWWRYKVRDTGEWSGSQRGGGMGGFRFHPNINIRLVDHTGEGISLQFDAPIPPEAAEQLFAAMEAWMNDEGMLPVEQVEALQDLFGAFDYLKSQNAGLKFTVKADLPDTAAMAARIFTDGMPVIEAGWATVWIHPDTAANPTNFGEEAPAVVLHELLHLNPAYGAADVQRWTRNGARPLTDSANAEAYDIYHQSYFYARARALQRILVRGSALLSGIPVITKGTSGNDTLLGLASFNDIEGQDGDNILEGRGEADFLWGGSGNDTYVFGPQSNDYLIHDEGGANKVSVTANLGIDNMRIRRVGAYWLLEMFNGAPPAVPSGRSDGVIAIAPNASGGPSVQFLEIGGRSYSIPTLVPIGNSAPVIAGPSVVSIPRAQFNSPNIAIMQASDPDNDVVTLSVANVSGLGSDNVWSFSGNILMTNYVNPGVSGSTLVTIVASDRWASTSEVLRVNWQSTVRPT